MTILEISTKLSKDLVSYLAKVWTWVICDLQYRCFGDSHETIQIGKREFYTPCEGMMVLYMHTVSKYTGGYWKCQ